MGDKREEEIITFGTFLKSCRVEKGVSQEKLARGLMSKSMLSKIENKGLTPDYLMRNRLMERLGLSAEGCEDFLQASEYARYEKRLKLMTAIEARQTHHAREILEELAETLKGEEKIERQFLLDMEGRIRRQEKRPGDEIFAVYDEAVNLTIPSVSCGFADCVFAPEEYYLLICRADYMDSPNDEEELENILKSIQACKLWKFAKAKILPLAAIKYAQIILRNNSTTEELELALAYVNEAVETLRETSRMYCLMDLLNVRGDLLCNLVDHYPMLKIEEEENQHFQNAFLYLYENYGSGIKPEDDCYIYRSPEIHSVADVVLSRRKALGVTRKMLTNICDEKTLSRLERAEKNTQDEIVNQIFQYLNLPSGYRRAEILTNDIKVLSLYDRVGELDNEGRYTEASQQLAVLKSILRQDAITNKQAIMRLESLLLLHRGKISREEYVRRMEDCLALSGISLDIAIERGVYLSRIERQCIHNLMHRLNRINEYQILLNHQKEGIAKDNAVGLFELGSTWCASEIGNQGFYKESMDKTHELIGIIVQYHRGGQVPINVFNEIWNRARASNEKRREEYVDVVENVLFYSLFFRRERIAALVEERLGMLRRGEDWTN